MFDVLAFIITCTNLCADIFGCSHERIYLLKKQQIINKCMYIHMYVQRCLYSGRKRANENTGERSKRRGRKAKEGQNKSK